MNIWYLCCTRHFTGGITMSLPMTAIHAARRTFRWDWGVITSAAASTVVTGRLSEILPTHCKKRIRQDKDRGIIALWHDESHINWYAFTHPHYRLLDASFCFFPGWDTVKPCYIYIRPKEEYFDVDAFKRDPPKTQLSPKVEKYNEFMLKKAARKIQRHMPWLPRRKKWQKQPPHVLHRAAVALLKITGNQSAASAGRSGLQSAKLPS